MFRTVSCPDALATVILSNLQDALADPWAPTSVEAKEIWLGYIVKMLSTMQDTYKVRRLEGFSTCETSW